jgi:hypothetical protein
VPSPVPRRILLSGSFSNSLMNARYCSRDHCIDFTSRACFSSFWSNIAAA